MNAPDRRVAATGKTTLWFLVVGTVIRLLALNQPLVDAHLMRQTQTAIMTQGIMEEPGWHLGGRATWRGDLPARLVQELPVYNYLVIPVFKLTGRLDASGKLVSVILWVLGFLMLQRIWSRCLAPGQTFWANVLFVLAPLSVFFGQAFMPEMLIQLLAFSFLVALLRYQEQPATGRFLIASGIGLLGMLVKGPEIAHLYLVAAILVFKSENDGALRRPVYWLVLIITTIAIKCWSRVIDISNQQFFPEWTSHNYLVNFVGSFWSHLDPVGYLKIVAYLTCFVLTPVGLLLALVGGWRLFRTRPFGFPAWWVGSIIFFFVFWSGPVSRGQSYYNLPALGPCALLFGTGADWLLKAQLPLVPRFRWAAAVLLAVLAPFLIGGSLYLFRPDRVVLESTQWIREHTRPNDLILLKANHRADTVDYQALAAFPYYARRRFWVYSRFVSPEEIKRGLETSRFALVTIPPQNRSWVATWQLRFKGRGPEPENIEGLLAQSGFQPVYTNTQFIVWSK